MSQLNEALQFLETTEYFICCFQVAVSFAVYCKFSWGLANEIWKKNAFDAIMWTAAFSASPAEM